MQLRLLGRTGLKVSPLCLGAMNFGARTPTTDALNIINRAVDNGINFINTADMNYSGMSESIVGSAIKTRGLRDQVILSTEISGPDMGVPHEPNLTRRYIVQACEKSLRRLDTDYIDLYNIPRPNPNIPIEEPLRALSDLISEGKIRYIGSSTFPAWMVLESLFVSEKLNLYHVMTEQPPYNLLDRRIENELIPLALKYDMALIPWAPLAQGVLAGRYTDLNNLPKDSRAVEIGKIYRERVNQKGIEIGKKVSELAKHSGRTPAQFSYLWVRDQPGVTAPIVGVRTMEQLDELLPALNLELTTEERRACDEITPPGTAVANFFNTAPWMKMKV
jgi:1-deoxyxylulose-5-phosphate synthase